MISLHHHSCDNCTPNLRTAIAIIGIALRAAVAAMLTTIVSHRLITFSS